MTKRGRQVVHVEHVGSAHTDAHLALLLAAARERCSPGPTAAGKPIATPDVVLFDPTRVRIERYWYRGTRIPSPYDPAMAA